MPKLTEQEQQEIIRYFEADKPLPEKYLFLLFEDKREVELVWTARSTKRDFVVKVVDIFGNDTMTIVKVTV